MSAIDDALNEFGSRTAAIHRELIFAASAEISSNTEIRERTALWKASAYTLLAAAFENFIRSLLRAVIDEISARKVVASKLKIGLVALHATPCFQSLGDLRDHEQVWDRRLQLVDFPFEATKPVAFNSAILPLDQRTPTDYHLRVIWRVFQLHGKPLPDPVSELALRDLALNRNQVAHGNEDPIRFGRNKSGKDVLKSLELVEGIALHLHRACETYLRNKAYLR